MPNRHGGARPGAGRPSGQPTRIVGVRVPASEYERMKALLNAYAKRVLRRVKEEPCR